MQHRTLLHTDYSRHGDVCPTYSSILFGYVKCVNKIHKYYLHQFRVISVVNQNSP